MPNIKYLTKAVAKAAERPPQPVESVAAWARGLTADQLRAVFQVIVEELARRANLEPDKLRQLRTVVLSLAA